MARAKQLWTLVLIVMTGLFFASPCLLLAEEEVKYDPYGAAWKYPKLHTPEGATTQQRTQTLKRIFEQPFRPLAHGIGKSAEFIEREHWDDKTLWFFDKLEQRGLTVGIRRPHEGGYWTTGLGGRLALEKLLQMEQRVVSAEVFGGWTPNYDFVGSTVDFGGRYRINLPTEKRFFHEGIVRYYRSSGENFFGTGHLSSRGNWTTYKPEETKLTGKFGYEFTDTVEGTSYVTFQKMNIGNGNRERVAKIKEYFNELQAPGMNGKNLMGYGTTLKHDTRDMVEDPKRGGLQEAGFAYFHDVDGEDIHYLKFNGEVAHFIPLWSDRRILALRLSAEKNKSVGGDAIPFFNLARLGGAKKSDDSELLRGYHFNRFFDEGLIVGTVEYRYNIWEYGSFASDAAALFDVGEVFREVKRFVFHELRCSGGGSINLKVRRKPILTLTYAIGDEGGRLSLHTKATF